MWGIYYMPVWLSRAMPLLRRNGSQSGCNEKEVKNKNESIIIV